MIRIKKALLWIFKHRWEITTTVSTVSILYLIWLIYMIFRFFNNI